MAVVTTPESFNAAGRCYPALTLQTFITKLKSKTVTFCSRVGKIKQGLVASKKCNVRFFVLRATFHGYVSSLGICFCKDFKY